MREITQHWQMLQQRRLLSISTISMIIKEHMCIIIRPAVVVTREVPMDTTMKTTNTISLNWRIWRRRDRVEFILHRQAMAQIITTSCRMIQLMCCRQLGEFNFAFNHRLELHNESWKWILIESSTATLSTTRMVNGRDVFVSETRECFCDSPVEGHVRLISFKLYVRVIRLRLSKRRDLRDVFLAPLISSRLMSIDNRVVFLLLVLRNLKHEKQKVTPCFVCDQRKRQRWILRNAIFDLLFIIKLCTDASTVNKVETWYIEWVEEALWAMLRYFYVLASSC